MSGLKIPCFVSTKKPQLYATRSSMVQYHLHPELEAWAKEQVSKGLASSVEALVADAVLARKRDSEWLNKLFKVTLASVEREGWFDGEQIMRDMEQWTRDLDAEIEDFEAFRTHKMLMEKAQ
jgi:hypothetical protein